MGFRFPSHLPGPADSQDFPGCVQGSAFMTTYMSGHLLCPWSSLLTYTWNSGSSNSIRLTLLTNIPIRLSVRCGGETEKALSPSNISNFKQNSKKPCSYNILSYPTTAELHKPLTLLGYLFLPLVLLFSHQVFSLFLYFKFSCPIESILSLLLEAMMPISYHQKSSKGFFFFKCKHSLLPHRNSSCQNDKYFHLFTLIFMDGSEGSAKLNDICKITKLARKMSKHSKANFVNKKEKLSGCGGLCQ